MHTDTHTGLDSPKGNWWKPAHKAEKVWVAIAFVWCMVLFAMMPLWHWKGGQNPSGIRGRTTPDGLHGTGAGVHHAVPGGRRPRHADRGAAARARTSTWRRSRSSGCRS